jgi:menaquinone-9 beta-reductase
MSYDVAIVGGGPAGASCASFCAMAGLRVVVLERETFPREKVCGDCLNPACWPVLRRLRLEDGVRALPHGALDRVDFIAINGRSVSVNLPAGAEIAVKRSLFDQLLFDRARQLGAELHGSATVTQVKQEGSSEWTVDTKGASFRARILVGADGRNSTVARFLNFLPRPSRERVALQTHIALPPDFGNRIVLQFRPEGYSGQAPVGPNELNLCLVSVPRDITSLKRWATQHFQIPQEQTWRTITPLTRASLPPARRNLFFVGDAARVVEPFTGEGIFYALSSGELAARAAVALIQGREAGTVTREFIKRHASLYHGRLWINQLARAAVLSPGIASFFVSVARFQPAALRVLTGNIVRPMT